MRRITYLKHLGKLATSVVEIRNNRLPPVAGNYVWVAVLVQVSLAAR